MTPYSRYFRRNFSSNSLTAAASVGVTTRRTSSTPFSFLLSLYERARSAADIATSPRGGRPGRFEAVGAAAALAAARIIEITDKRLWRIVEHYVGKALATVENHRLRILERWTSTHSNVRLQGFNGLFQAARARARGYRNTTTFATTIYLIAAPLGDLFKSI